MLNLAGTERDWARPRSKRLFVSYSRGETAELDLVYELVRRLQDDGVEVSSDQDVPAPPGPAEGWALWTICELETAGVVLVVCSESYNRRFLGLAQIGPGAGVALEGAVISRELFERHGLTTKFIPVGLSRNSRAFIPEGIRTEFIDLTEDSSYQKLLDYLHKPWDVYLSHDPADTELAGKLAAHLRQNYLQVYEPWLELEGLQHRQALEYCKSIVLCVGPFGLRHNRQRIDVDVAREVAETNQLGLYVVDLGESGSGAADILKGQVRYRWAPPRRYAPELLGLLKPPRDSRRPAADSRAGIQISTAEISLPELPTQARWLAENVKDNGLTVFVGSVWPDRDQPGVYNPALSASRLMEMAGLASHPARDMSLELAAHYYTFSKAVDPYGTAVAQEEIVDLLEKNSLRGPAAFSALAELAQWHWHRTRDRRDAEPIKPFVLMTSNIDLLLERHLVELGVPFLRVVLGREEVLEQLQIDRIEVLDGGGREMCTEGPEGGRTATEALAEAGEQLARRRIEQEGTGPEGIRLDLQIDAALKRHIAKVRKVAQFATSDAWRELAHARDSWFRSGLPVLVKAFGTVEAPREDPAATPVVDIEIMMQLQREDRLWIPNDLGMRFKQTASLFVGHSYADLRFLHLWAKALAPRFDKSKDRARRLFLCPGGVACGDGFAEVDQRIVRLTSAGKVYEYRPFVVVDKKPADYLREYLEYQTGGGNHAG